MPLGGKEDWLDTPLEFALLSYYSKPVVTIRPVEAQQMLPANTNTSEIKLAAAVYKELQEIKFLDPKNTARYETMLRFIRGSHGVTQTDIDMLY
jgi:hypothetical protein